MKFIRAHKYYILQVACIILGVLLHYILLSAFCWMLCDGILIYILLFHVLYEGFFRKWIFFMIIGWGNISYCLLLVIAMQMV